MPNPSQEPPVSSKAPDQDFEDIEVLCTFKINLESQNSDHGCIKDMWQFPNENQDAKLQSGTSSILQSSKSGLKGNIYSLQLQKQDKETKLKNGCTKEQLPYPNQDQDDKPQWGTSGILQSSKWWLKGHGCSLHLQNQDREPKFGSWLYQRPVTIFKSRSRCQTPVRNLQPLPKPQIRT